MTAALSTLAGATPFKWPVEIRIVHCKPCQVEWNGVLDPNCWLCGQPGGQWALQPHMGSRQILPLHFEEDELADLDPERDYI